MPPAPGAIHIGTSGWSYRDWRERFYPPGSPADQHLAFYASQFCTVEVNATFFRLPERSVFATWRATVPSGFVFAVKASRYLTHMKKQEAARRGGRDRAAPRPHRAARRPAPPDPLPSPAPLASERRATRHLPGLLASRLSLRCRVPRPDLARRHGLRLAAFAPGRLLRLRHGRERYAARHHGGPRRRPVPQASARPLALSTGPAVALIEMLGASGAIAP